MLNYQTLQFIYLYLSLIPKKVRFSFASQFIFAFTLLLISFNFLCKFILPYGDFQKLPSSQIVEVVSDLKNKEPVILKERKIEIKLAESNFDKEQKLIQEAEKIESQKKLAKRDLIVRERPSFDPSLEEKRAKVKEAASRYGIDWRILEAVWQVESGKSWDTKRRSSKGAVGPLQFLPSTFRKYAPPSASIYSASDSLYAAAHLLASAGASNGEVEGALYAYNHSRAYVKKVLKIARELGY